ncbi:MAG: hypothetical protein JWM59_3101 [Verrucomicrobiales bacterium]|nr:hypothetical protein [Verrucomicrobiales bacterium]
MRTTSGAGIGWFSIGAEGKNLLDHWDHGRLIQQSYYGKHDGTRWMDQPWTWNPVQGGDFKGGPAKVLELKAEKTSLYAKTMARHWSGCMDLPEGIFEEWISLEGRLAKIKFRFTYSGTETHPEQSQEIPAVFTEPHLTTLVIYDGEKPWTGGALSRSQPGWPNESRKPTEKWAAWVGSDDRGIGIHVPSMENLTCYRFGKNPDAKGACSYCAPLIRFAITPGKVFEYDAWVTAGSVDEIRTAFAKLQPLPPAPTEKPAAPPAPAPPSSAAAK